MEAANTFAKSNESISNKMHPNTSTEIDKALSVLSANKDGWISIAIAERISLLDDIRQKFPAFEKRWIAASLKAKGTQTETMGEAEEWAGISTIYRQIIHLTQALKDIDKHGSPIIRGNVRTRKNGQVVAQVMPANWKEKMAFPGIRSEVWMHPDVSLHGEGIPQASFYHREDKKGKICAVLAGGNFPALASSDFLHKLFVEGQVVALKMNPVNEYLGPILEEVFSGLVNGGYLQILYGGAKEGAYLCNHPSVETVHLTGSGRTYEAVVFGPGQEGAQRKRSHQPIFKKHFSAELGNISPVIIVPGPWSKKDIKRQSSRLGSWLVMNAGCNCLTPRMIIQQKNWQHREALNTGIEEFLSKIELRKAYYPGSRELHNQFVEEHPEALQLGEPRDGQLPWTFITNVDARNESDICFKREPFLSLFSETALEANDVVTYLSKAVEFANNNLWGNLVVSIIVHPKSLKDPEIAHAVDQAIANLKYGSIVVNNFGALPYYLGNSTWGAYPDNNLYDIQSGQGFVNNPLMFDRVEKSVTYTDFNPIVDPFLANLKNGYLLFQQDTRFQSRPSVWNLLKLMWRGMTLKEA